MGQRYDACSPRPYKKKKDGEEKTYWHKVGTAWQNDKGLVTIYLDSYPVPDPSKEGKAVIMLFEPKDEEQAAKSGKPSRLSTKYDEDEIPF
jgi:hypothetical protein